MYKLTIAVSLVTLACHGICKPQPPNTELARLAASGKFEEASQLLKKYYENSIKSFAPPNGFSNDAVLPAQRIGEQRMGNGNGEYYYQSEASYHSIVNNNGKVKEEQDGLGVIDNNGAITYYKPTSITS